MPKELVISAAPHETRVAILEDGQLCEIYIEREKEFALVGSIYKGRVTRVLPGMQSSFVDIGLDSDAFLYVGDFLENLEDYDHVVTAVEGKAEKMEQQGGTVFAEPSAASSPAGEPSAHGAGPAAPAQPASESGPPSNDVSPASEFDSGVREIGNRLPADAQPHGNQQPPRSFRPPAAPFDRSGRGPGQGQGGGQGRGPDRGGDRGGRRRGGGRWRRGGRSGGDSRQNRDLPPSKYAAPGAPRPYISRPYDPPAEPTEAYEPVILPGESLAKYKDRIPGSAASAAPAVTDSTESSAAPASAPPQSAAGLPSSLYAARGESSVVDVPPVESTPRHEEEHDEASAAGFVSEPVRESASSTEAPVLSEYAAMPEEPPRAFASHDPIAEPHEPGASLATPVHGPDLSDEEMTVLAEQLAEARQEEVAAEAAAVAREQEHDHEEEASAAGEDSADDASEEHLTAGEESGGDQHSIDAAGEPHDDAGHESGEPGNFDSEGLHAQPDSQQDAQHAQPGQERPPMSARMSDPQRARFQRPMRRGRQQRGGGGSRYPRSGGDRRQQQAPRRPQLISEMLKAGQEIIVQIAKEPLGKKGARITSHVALPGRFLVYMPTVNHIGVSRRIASAEERSRLRHLVTDSKGTFPGGFIVRTAAEGAPDDEIRSDVEFLGRTWDKIRAAAEPKKAPALLHRDLNLVERILRDYVSNDYTAIWIDNEEEYSKVVEFVGRFQPKLVSRVKLYTKPAPIFEEFGIQQDLDRALRPKVWLKSGGYIVINHTEALVAIDVNTGKYVGRGSTRLEDTIVKTNLEAVKEIVRQIRLRDLGGIIVLDLIDMEERRNREKVMAALEAALRTDRAPSKALPFNEFGLVTVTRKRTKQALERVLCQPCPYCTGSGMVKSIPTICYEIQAEARKMAADLEASSITLRVHPEIAKALKTREAALVDELEQTTRKSAIIQADPTLHWEQYDIY